MKKNLSAFVAMVAASILTIGCDGFGQPPSSMSSDAGAMPADDAGERPRTETDGGMRMPPELDAGTNGGPISGGPCDPETDEYAREEGLHACETVRCESAYLDCRDRVWHCVSDEGAICQPLPETDAGTPSVGTDAGSPVTISHDAGSLDYCVPGSFVGCWLACGYPGHIDCNPATGRYDANGGACQPFEGLECPTPRTDAGTPPVDAGTDSGPPAVDAGTDAGRDAGTDAGTDAGSPATRTIEFLFHVPPALLPSTDGTRRFPDYSSLALLEEMALAGASHADARLATCDAGESGLVTYGVDTYFRCRMTRLVGAELFFAGRYRTTAADGWSAGSFRATMSGWERTSCGSGSATPGVLWVIRDTSGRSLLNPDGLPDIVQPRGITEEGWPVCRGRFVF